MLVGAAPFLIFRGLVPAWLTAGIKSFQVARIKYIITQQSVLQELGFFIKEKNFALVFVPISFSAYNRGIIRLFKDQI
jgi:TRAP-type mannitol/chloroaromatic compound transport system permease large subunit